jgi:NADH-quinone oxidoreductase subunit H
MAEFLSQYIPLWLASLLWAGVQSGLLLALVIAAAMIFIWMERKVSARIQDRLGPMRTGGRFGWLQPPADGIKLLCKEDLIPAAADKLLFRIAPYICFATCFGVFIALPWTGSMAKAASPGSWDWLALSWVPVRMNIAVFFIMAVSGLEVFGVILAGYSSGSKWSLYGGMREAAQVISYEIPLGLCVVIPVLLAGTMDLVAIGDRQAGWFWNWHVLHDPFTFVTFFVYFTCAVAHTNRAPFDLPEADSELVAGFLTEYSGFRWTVFFMAEYGAMLAVCALASILFLGGWNGPIPVARLLGLTAENGALWGLAGNCLGFLNLLTKAVLGVTFMMAARWTLPRLRIDQVMTTCLKYCVPLASAMLAGVLVWCYFFPGGLWASFKGRAESRESRVESRIPSADSRLSTFDSRSIIASPSSVPRQFLNPQIPVPHGHQLA